MTNDWTKEIVIERFEEAVRTLKRWHVPGTKPKGYFVGWPEIVYTAWEREMQDKLPLRRGAPPAGEIDRMDETFRWLCYLDRVDERKVIVMKAEKKRWKTILPVIGCGRTHGWEIYQNALNKIVIKLNRL
ncbi:MAG: DUF6362 family protein [Proteobacteria bacterium]|nr:DUF6362 family protein [Pseudomonadota bacterium]